MILTLIIIVKIYESVSADGNHIVLPYTQQVKCIFYKCHQFTFKALFNMYVKVDKMHFYRKQWNMHEYYDFNKNSSTTLRLWNIDIS